MKLTILGMNGPYPAPGKACSGYLLQTPSAKIGFDLGTGTLANLTALTAPETLDALVFSHWHYDHSSDLLPLLYRLADAKAAGLPPLKVYGPLDESSATFRAARDSGLIELTILAPDDVFTVGGAEIRCLQARHPVPALMYRLTENGKIFAFTGDTNTVEGLPELTADADFLLADGLFTNATWAENKPHLSAEHCARLAAENHVKRLVITHLNPNLDDRVLFSEATAVFPKAELACMGGMYEW